MCARSIGGTGPGWYQDWVRGWARSKRREGRSPASIATWDVYIRHLGAFLEDHGVVTPELLTRAIVVAWQDTILEQLPNPNSRSVAIVAARNLLKWADAEEISARPGLWMRLALPHVPDALPRPLQTEDLAAIATHYAQPTSDLVRLRDRALFWFLVTTSARISEALQVRVDQVRGGRMIIRAKGGGEHLLMMSHRCQQWVNEYLRVRGRDGVDALWIHIGPRGRRLLRDDQANAIWAQLAQQLEIPHFTSHQLKHTSVTELGEREDSDFRLVRHVGWKDPRMMHRYRDLRDPKRQAMVDRLDELVPENPPPPRRRRRRRFRVVE